jgi:hypothetical protein
MQARLRGAAWRGEAWGGENAYEKGSVMAIQVNFNCF